MRSASLQVARYVIMSFSQPKKKKKKICYYEIVGTLDKKFKVM